MEKGEIIKQLSQLSSSFDKAQHDFLRDHPNVDPSNDARVIAENVREAIEDVYYGIKEPRQALDDAGAKSAKVLGW